jgi:glutamyl-tRNA synthetase
VLTEAGLGVVKAAYDALAGVTNWVTADIEAALNGKLVEELELKPRVAFGPVRVATSGAQISPPLFESLEILGRERTLARLQSALG